MQVLQGTLEMLVMEALAPNRELHGFGILDRITSATEGALAIEEGALYPALHRLAKKELIAATWGISSKGRRAKYYALTKAGKARLKVARSEWQSYVDAVARLAEGARG